MFMHLVFNVCRSKCAVNSANAKIKRAFLSVRIMYTWEKCPYLKIASALSVAYGMHSSMISFARLTVRQAE